MEISPVTPPGIDPGIDQLIAQRLNHYATPGPKTQKLNKHNKPENVVKILKFLYNNDLWKGKKPAILRMETDVSDKGQVEMTLLLVHEIKS